MNNLILQLVKPVYEIYVYEPIKSKYTYLKFLINDCSKTNYAYEWIGGQMHTFEFNDIPNLFTILEYNNIKISEVFDDFDSLPFSDLEVHTYIVIKKYVNSELIDYTLTRIFGWAAGYSHILYNKYMLNDLFINNNSNEYNDPNVLPIITDYISPISADEINNGFTDSTDNIISIDSHSYINSEWMLIGYNSTYFKMSVERTIGNLFHPDLIYILEITLDDDMNIYFDTVFDSIISLR